MSSNGNGTARVSTKEVIRSMNYNVKLVFGFYATNSLSRGLWMGSVLSLYISLFAEQNYFYGLSYNQILGVTSAASGLTMTLFVFPAGYLADRFRRDIILKASTVIGIAAVLFLIFGQSITFILISMLLLGLFNAFVRPSIESIFADSIHSGYRSRVYSWGHLVNQIASALGPFINIGLFAIFGNSHDPLVMRKVMSVGFAVMAVSIVLLYFFKDKRSLGDESEAIADEVTQLNGEATKSRLISKLDPKRAALVIPMLLVIGNVIIGVGAGMSIKFFPNLFKDQYLLNPIVIQLIMGGTALATGLLAIVSQKVSLKLGRVQTIFFAQFIATACLLVLSVYPPLAALIPIFIFRGSFMNAGQPLSRSILMDLIPKKQRGRWNSIEAIAWGLFWNASALIGGFIVGPNNNYNLCFIITTFVYIIGMIPIIIMMPLVGKEREAYTQEELDHLEIDKEESTEDSEMLTAELNTEKEEVESTI
ncbi:MAG: MFS transporter [Candidatus Heimdallarchaeota archaeon]